MTYAAFAFSSSYTPAAPDETPFIDQVVRPLVGANIAQYPIVRRLFFESYALTTSDMKNNIEKTDEDRPRNMTIA